MLEDSLSMLDNMIRYMEQSPRVDVIMVTDNDQALTLPPLPSSVCVLLVRVLVVLVLVNRTNSDHLFWKWVRLQTSLCFEHDSDFQQRLYRDRAEAACLIHSLPK